MPSEQPLPVLSHDDEDAHSEPTKVGSSALAVEEAIRAEMEVPNERATSKMSPFQLEAVLRRVGEAPAGDAEEATPPERSQTRAKAVPTPEPTPAVVVAPAIDRGARLLSFACIALAIVFVGAVCALLFT